MRIFWAAAAVAILVCGAAQRVSGMVQYAVLEGGGESI